MKTENNSMRIVKSDKEQERTAGKEQMYGRTPTGESASKPDRKNEENATAAQAPSRGADAARKPKKKYKTVEPVMLDAIPEDTVFIRSADVCKLLNISNSTLRNLRAEHAIPFYKLGGTFLYNREEIMNYLASNYSRRI